MILQNVKSQMHTVLRESAFVQADDTSDGGDAKVESKPAASPKAEEVTTEAADGVRL